MLALMAGRLEEVFYVLASGLSAFDTQSVALHAGRVMLTRLHQLEVRHRHFAFETTLATRSYLPWLRTLQAEGFAIEQETTHLSRPDVWQNLLETHQ